MNFIELTVVLQNVHSCLFQHVSRTVNLSLTVRNWLYGYFIQEYELKGNDRAKYGERILENLSKTLQSQGVTACSYRHLKLCRQLYQQYSRIGQAVFAQSRQLGLFKLSPYFGQATFAQSNNIDALALPEDKLLQSLAYSHFIELMKIDDPLKRSFYEVECILGNWSTRELKRQITTLYYERSGLSKNKEKLSQLVQKGIEPYKPKEIIRDPYIFEFLDIKPQEVMLESKLTNALLDKLQNFLLELGRGFCFEARNKRILIGDEYFFIDLVFYHRILKCNVLLELKNCAFSHQNIGQLNTYVNYYQRHEMTEGDNSPIGILLCTEKNHALVEFALGDNSKRIFVSKYQLELPSKSEIKQFLEKQLQEGLLQLSEDTGKTTGE